MLPCISQSVGVVAVVVLNGEVRPTWLWMATQQQDLEWLMNQIPVFVHVRVQDLTGVWTWGRIILYMTW